MNSDKQDLDKANFTACNPIWDKGAYYRKIIGRIQTATILLFWKDISYTWLVESTIFVGATLHNIM